MSYEIKTTVNVSDERVSDMFTNAVEGGSNYWCAKIRPITSIDKRSYDQYMLDGFIAWEEESSDDKGPQRVVTENDIKEALQIMADKYPRHFNDMINENDDADTGDVLLQLCCFKTLVYG
jgi:hypothetical protein